jgi:trehalose 6-phosphate phosphatase
LLARENAATLARFLSSRVLLAFDFDGTLAPIVADRSRARMRRRTRRLLAELCSRYPCAIISGRDPDDLSARLEGLPVRHVVGNHGLDSGSATASLASEMAGVRRSLSRALASFEGVVIEDKTYSLAVHYRRAPDRRRARHAIENALAKAQGTLRISSGKLVFDVVGAAAPHKGAALARLGHAEGTDTAIYVGDDATDEDVFRGADPSRLLPVRVGWSRRSLATHYVRNQRELDVFLAFAASSRSPSKSATDPSGHP